jgi:uncharacterized protein YijF (DUF1287 family)
MQSHTGSRQTVSQIEISLFKTSIPEAHIGVLKGKRHQNPVRIALHPVGMGAREALCWFLRRGPACRATPSEPAQA